MVAPCYDVERYGRALEFAARLHVTQVRKGTSIPYISHPLTVSSLVWEGGGDEDQAIAGLLHDAVEDQGGRATAMQIKQLFGERVAAIVEVCTDTDVTPKPAWRARKETHLARLQTAREDALIVVAADKLHNATATFADVTSPSGLNWSCFNAGPDDALWFYDATLCLLRRRIGSSPLVRRLGQAVAELHRVLLATT
jgi:(p)ppGpp synthase/HD superfamily hydrolase